MTVNLAGRYSTFTATIGNQFGASSGSSIRFFIVADGTTVFADTYYVNITNVARNISIDVRGVNSLKLQVDDGGNGSELHSVVG